MIVGAQLYTVREYTKTPEEIRKTFGRIASIGYTAVQVSAIGAIEPARLSEIAASHKLAIVITHTNPDRILTETEAVIEEHKTFGCRHIGIGAMPQKYRGSAEGFRSFITDFGDAARLIADKGLKLHYHHHAFEYEKFGGKTGFDLLLQETDPALWGIIPDTYWIQVGGRCPAQQIEQLTGRVEVCHFKDLAIVSNAQRMAPVLEGNLCWDEIFAACKKAGILYAMVEQDDCYGMDPFDALRLSFENLQKVLL